MENPFDSSPATGSHELKKNANEIFFLLTTFIKPLNKERKKESKKKTGGSGGNKSWKTGGLNRQWQMP